MQLQEEPFLRIRLRGRDAEVSGLVTSRLGQVNLPASLQTGADVFAEWHWDGHEVLLTNCHLGFFPLYYYATDDEFGVSPSIETLLQIGAPRDLDDAAMAVYLRMGWTLGEDTVFRAIRTLPPHGTVRWSGKTAQVSSRFTFPRSLDIGREQAIDGFGEAMAEAVRRRSGEGADVVMPLSGGRDSRSILFELHRCGRLPKLFVTNHDFPPYRRENIDVSRLLADRLGVRHLAVGQPASRLRCELLKNRLNNFGAAENVWCVSLYSKLGQEYANPIVYEGSPGAASYGSYVDDESVAMLARGQTAALAARMLDRWLTWQASEDALQRVLTREAAARFTRDAAIDRLSRELTRCQSAANPLPPSVKVDKALHTAATHRVYPEFGDVPFAGELRTPLIESNSHYRRLLLESLAYVAAIGTGRLVQRGAFMRRLVSLAASGGNIRMRMKWIAPYAGLYLTQLESLLSRPRGAH